MSASIINIIPSSVSAQPISTGLLRQNLESWIARALRLGAISDRSAILGKSHHRQGFPVLRLVRSCVLSAAAALTLITVTCAVAQGGPPMVTDDPETPGNGRWEINVALVANHTSGRSEAGVPLVDLNYGLGERLQLKVEVPWMYTRDSGQPWKSGLGEANLGVKWRFLNDKEAGFSMSTYPQYRRSVLESSIRRGITQPGHEIFVPMEVASTWNDFDFDAEIGRNFTRSGENQWVAGLIGAHDCSRDVKCMVEVRGIRAKTDRQVLLNFGVKWKLGETLALIGAAGRDVGSYAEDRRQFLVYLGVQISR